MHSMTYDEARESLQREGWLRPNGDIYDPAQYIDCTIPGLCALDGQFDIDQLEAIVVYLRHGDAS